MSGPKSYAEHGTEAMYQRGCRGECCREAHRKYRADRRKRLEASRA